MVGAGAPPPPASILAPRPALTLRGLLPATPYDVTVTARNARGSSAPLSVTATTSGKSNRKWGGENESKTGSWGRSENESETRKLFGVG